MAVDVFCFKAYLRSRKNLITDPVEVYFKKGLFEFYGVCKTLP